MAQGLKFVSFKFPEEISKISQFEDTSVCIISIIGKTPLQGNKAGVISRVLDRNNVFGEENKAVSGSSHRWQNSVNQ